MFKFNKPNAEIYFPQGAGDDRILARTTHLGIGAHQDDLEIFAIHGILAGLDNREKAFTGVTVTDGRGAPRSGPYADMSDDTLWKVRNAEQKKAADIGHYNAQILLDHASRELMSSDRDAVIADLQQIIRMTQPESIYTHNLADKHATHLSVALSVIEALRTLIPPLPSVTLYGCEVWGDLDWLPDEIKVALDVSGHAELQKRLLDVYESQIVGGKRYDLAAIGRRVANATYYQSHQTDQASRLTYAMDLTPLIRDPDLNINNFILEKIDQFKNDVANRLERLITHQ
ncbi:MAG: PIG-L family deacetylase [Chloroflexota bacterium]|nr:PIG-L family deacetylase [Chloroflexota bacterium]